MLFLGPNAPCPDNPKRSLFQAHPEWFAFDGKQRIPGIGGEFGTNFCTSNPDAVSLFMKNFVVTVQV